MGDVGYYAPGNDLVLYYGDQSYYAGIVVLGRMEGDAAERIATIDGPITATTETVEDRPKSVTATECLDSPGAHGALRGDRCRGPYRNDKPRPRHGGRQAVRRQPPSTDRRTRGWSHR